ncbi:MAG TPA: TonB-dependent receptor [Burkholderiaceae bacterium]|nr:TonB-dependent receptor [Burkholderiaceae bacterium]HMY99142.1 TonB-dependent receptor [Burkholderiaceae bacterium]HNB44162.1 TonB-dependent receptor [Burkholderiaceae bacterium]HNG78468.1 TonB-dependent receptor [Burkholderiaceae bacterium]
MRSTLSTRPASCRRASPRLSPLSLALAAALPLSAAFAPTAQAAETAAPAPAAASAPTVLAPVVVTGVRPTPLPQSEGPSERQLIARRAATSDSAKLLLDVPGLSLYTAGGVSSLPAIRGLADDRLRVQVDGMDLVSACANHMNPPLSYIDASAVRGVEVFAGIAPVSAGGDSIGGTIALRSADPEFAAAGAGLLTRGEVGASARSNGRAAAGHLGATLASEQVSLSYRGSIARADNYHSGHDFKAAGPAAAGRETLDADEVGSTAYRSVNHALSTALRLGPQQLAELRLGLQDISKQNWPNQRMDMTGNDSVQTNLRYQGRFDWGGVEVRLYHEDTEHQMQFGDDKLYWYGPTGGSDGVAGPIGGGTTGYAAGMPMDTHGRNTGLTLKADTRLNERDLLRAGSEWQRYRLDDWWDPSGKGMWPNTFWNIRDGQRDRAALFGEWEAQWSPQWLSHVGLRHETVTMDAGPVQGYNATFSPTDEAAFNAADRHRRDRNLNLVALARFKPAATQTVEIGYAMKTRSPNLYERYAWSSHGMVMRMVNLVGDGNGYVGNLALQPETAHTLSAAAEWRADDGKAWHLRLSPYLTQIENYIDAERCFSSAVNTACTAANLTLQNGFVYLRYVNQSARLYGLDLSGDTQLGQWGALGAVSTRAQLSYLRGKNRDTGDNLYNMMPLHARFALEQRLPLAGGSFNGALEAEAVAAKDRVSATRNEQRTAGYGLLHLRTGWESGGLRIDAGIENLLNHHYQHPLGGAYTGQGKTMSATGVPWGTPVPGAGRSIYAGLNYRF